MLSIRKIAQMANVGVGTVSRYRNGFTIKQSTKEKIERAIELSEGYFVRQCTIGVIVPVINDSFSGVLVDDIVKQFSNKKHKVIVIVSDDLEKDCNHILSLNPDGLIIHPAHKDCIDGLCILAKKLPTILIDMMFTPAVCDQMLSLNAQSTYECVEYLLQQGHSKIAIVTGGSLMLMGDERLLGYKRAIKDYGLATDETYIIDAGDNKTVEDSLTKLMAGKNRPTAVIATNYDITLATIRALMNLNLKYPDDISFVGFDEFGMNKILHRPISYIEQPIHEMAKSSTELLLKRILGDKRDYPLTKHFKTKLVEGSSVLKRPHL